MDTHQILAQIDAEIARLEHVKSILSGITTQTPKRSVGRPRVAAAITPKPLASKRRQISEEGRARIAAAQKARWAKSKKAAKTS